MKLLYFLFRTFRNSLLLALLISAFSGIANTALVALASKRLTGGAANFPAFTLLGETQFGFLIIFIGLLILALCSDLVGKWLLARLTGKTANHLRLSLAQQILQARYEQIEQIGPARLQALLTEDISAIGQIMGNLPQLVIALATTIGCVIYLGWLSPITLLGLGLLTIPAVIGYQLLQHRATRHAKDAQRTRHRLFDHYRSLVEGVKELLLNDGRRHAFLHKLLQPTAKELMNQATAARVWHQAAQSWSQSVYFIFILGIFALSDLRSDLRQLDLGVMTTYALVVLYLKSAIFTVLQSLSVWADANVALDQIEQLGFSLKAELLPTKLPSKVAILPTIQIALCGLEYQYQAENDERSFTLGPIDLTLRSGELVFVIGGNGSGKTTLIKLLAGLYTAQSGEIYWNGARVSEANLSAYRQNFSVIFADFFLFDQLLGIEGWQIGQQAEHYLHQLQLERKVKIQGQQLSTITLSHGQRKRLALLTAWLEDRPVYIFDEWAASQDPEFREVFYRQLLPELRKRGKLVLVISHDDHYFDVADRVIKLDFGKIESSQSIETILHLASSQEQQAEYKTKL